MAPDDRNLRLHLVGDTRHMTTVHPSIPLIAGEPLAAGDTCYIAFRGPWSWRVYRWAQHDLAPLPEPVGVAGRDYLTGDTVTLSEIDTP